MGQVNERNLNPYSWVSFIPLFKKIKDKDEMYRNFGLTNEEIDIISICLEEKVKFIFEDLSNEKDSYYSRIVKSCKNYLSVAYNYLIRNRNK